METLKSVPDINLHRDATPIYLQLGGAFPPAHRDRRMAGRQPDPDARCAGARVRGRPCDNSPDHGPAPAGGIAGALSRARNNRVAHARSASSGTMSAATGKRCSKPIGTRASPRSFSTRRPTLPPPPDYAGDMKPGDYRLYPSSQCGSRQARGGRCGLAAQRHSGAHRRHARCGDFPPWCCCTRCPSSMIDRVLQTITIASADVEIERAARYSAQFTARGHSSDALRNGRHAAVPLSEHQSRRCIPAEDASAIASSTTREPRS